MLGQGWLRRPCKPELPIQADKQRDAAVPGETLGARGARLRGWGKARDEDLAALRNPVDEGAAHWKAESHTKPMGHSPEHFFTSLLSEGMSRTASSLTLTHSQGNSQHYCGVLQHKEGRTPPKSPPQKLYKIKEREKKSDLSLFISLSAGKIEKSKKLRL